MTLIKRINLHYASGLWVGTCLHPGIPEDQKYDYINQVIKSAF